MSLKIGQNVNGVYISGRISLKDVEDKYGTNAARDTVSEWYVGMVIDSDIFLSMMIHYKQLRLREIATMDWEKEPISVKKIKDIQKEIMEKGYAHLLPFTIRDLLIREKQQKPDVNFFIEDATHRSIALADLLVKGKLNQAPISVFYGTLKEGY